MKARIFLAIFAMAGLSSGARAQEWLLNAAASRLYMQTAKADAIIEIHRFTGLDGAISRDGEANVKIDLGSVVSGIDVRDVRMRFLLFETFKFPNAEITAKIDMANMRELLTATRVSRDLGFTLALHGVTKNLETPVTVTRVGDKSISVASARPLVIDAESFGFLPGLAKLSEAINGTHIVAAASITFDLVFETGEKIPEIQTARIDAERSRLAAESAIITREGCETRFTVISAARAIYFKTGSSELDRVSDPLLASIADIAKRCPAMKIEIDGHTDAAGTKAANQQLSEQRARAVFSWLVDRGVEASRMKPSGYGDTRPSAPNDSEANRAKNRRIEFRVLN